MDTLYAGPDSLGSTSAEFEPPPTDFTAPVAERRDMSPEIAETPVVVFESVRRNGHGEGGNTPSPSPRLWSNETDRTIGEDGDYGETQTVTGTSVADDNGHDGHNEHNTDATETDNLQRADQTETIVNTDGSNEASPSVVESFEHTRLPATASPPSLPDLGDGGLTVVDISSFTAVKICDKRSGPSGVEYECELGQLWLAVDLVEKVQMGRVHIRTYESGLIQERRRGTLRPNKRKHSEM